MVVDIYNRTARTVVLGQDNWKAFLDSACRNFKLRFDEQLLVFAQRPDATAVLEIEKWNKKFGRWVNKGARGIAVLENPNNEGYQRLKYYFDISDTHEGRLTKKVPIWKMKEEYEEDVIETLENTFGELKYKGTLVEAIVSASENAVEDNLADYFYDLNKSKEDSLLEELDELNTKDIYETLVTNSVAYMVMKRLGIDPADYFDNDDFKDIINFNTEDTLDYLGVATRDIAEIGLSEIARTINSLDRSNRTIAERAKTSYTEIEEIIENETEQNERSKNYERDNLHEAGGLSIARSQATGATEGRAGQIRKDEEGLSGAISQGDVFKPTSQGEASGTPSRGGEESDRDGGRANLGNVESRGSNGETQGRGYDELGKEDEQHKEQSSGDSESRSDLRRVAFDRANERKDLDFFHDTDDINELLTKTPHLKASKSEIKDFYLNTTDEQKRIEFIKGIFNDDFTEITLDDGRTVGYKTYENVLHMWEGSYDTRIAEGYYSWAVIASRFEGIRLLGMLFDDAKPIPSISEQQSLIEKDAEEKTSAFSFSQEIIDAVLTKGSGVAEGKMRIYEQFQKSLSSKENIEFLKHEYGWGGAYPVITGTGIDEQHDGKGIHLKRGFGEGKPQITLSWSQVEKRLSDLVKLDRYLNPKEMEYYPKWLEKEEMERAEVEELKRNREILSKAPDEMEREEEANYEYHLGDKVYLGNTEYEILSFDEETVKLYDTSFPLFNKEMEREDFDLRVKENPFNDHLKAPKEQSKNEPISAESEKTEEIAGVTQEDSLEKTIENTAEEEITEVAQEVEAKGDETKEVETVILTPSFKKTKTRAEVYDIHPEIPMRDRLNFDLASNEIEEVPKKERFKRNIMAIQVLKNCENENRFATAEEQVILSKYVGWGGLPEAFDENNSTWKKEYLELKAVLSDSEYTKARESTLTAFYTPPELISAVYKALENMGFKEGNILEPSCGTGNYIGMLPKEMGNSKVYGVEIDSISAGIARQLYQKTSIANKGFENTNLPDSFFDAVVGNVPFGDFKVNDKRYNKENFVIHDYFFAKSLDKLRPGGIMALITSKGTMDKGSSRFRRYIAQRADLLGAIRLPNDTYKGNAGTEVVSDILFFQKRDRIVDLEPDWVNLNIDENGRKMNSYFVEHPEMVLGEWQTVNGKYGQENTVVPYDDSNLAELLEEAISNIHGEISAYEQEEELEEEDNSIPADPTVRNFSYTLVDGKVYFRENSRMVPPVLSATAENRIKGMIEIRDAVRNLIELQTEDLPDEDIKKAQEKLNEVYDGFTNKYGLISDRANKTSFFQDSSYFLLSALEILDDEGKLERKADMFSKRTIKPHVPVTSVDTASEAYALSMGEKARVDMEYMCDLTGKSEEEIYSDLKGVIFLNPLHGYGDSDEPKYLPADEYLSGNVREKLKTARRTAQLYPEDYTVNVEALEKVQPKDLLASEIAVRLGATWVPPEIVEQFIFEFLDTPRYAQWNIKVHFSKLNGEWNVEGKSYDRSNVKAYSTYGTGRINAYKIIEETLNLKDVRIFDYVEDEDGKRKAVLNKKETAIAQSKQELIKQGFKDWIWQDPARRERLTKIYNERFNSLRPREYDGSHIEFAGMNPEIELREHQKNAVAHILYGGNTLLAHCVGAGKTFEMTAAAMESKRLGLCSKSLFVVPNHLTEQWAAEFLQLYPSANILVATKKDFETKNRKRFCGRIATGDYDAIIIGHSQFEKIPMSIERQKAILEQQIQDLLEGIAELKHNRGDKFSIKQMEKAKKTLKVRLEKLNDQSRKDDVVTFEELGVDRLFIDESHFYKNLFLYTKMKNVGGVAQSEAQKSNDLFMKCRYLDELTGGRGTVFATGTPISNSMVELYTIQRYLQYDTLQKNSLQHFDAWASTFGETVTAIELTPEGYTLIGQ